MRTSYILSLLESCSMHDSICRSNFEVASLAFFRSAGYQRYFMALDASDAFFVERSGDAPVRHVVLAKLLKRPLFCKLEEHI